MVRYPHCLRNFTPQFLINIRNQNIKIFWICATDIMDIHVFAALFSLLLVLAGEIGLWIDVRREASSDRIVTRRPNVREWHAMNLP
ncbi:hypothetical protein P167DRAFT_532741 [Morchella conica CCBAS932]|uniref:Uncharacterized protein n=1 Tax=Morchella conica CCBAS932 TaxID=1392247 RepID=A0A3N4L589_9PEZI|nr:hypothetical protein P167DRAFT_532741 [Morchella conica CCBAS932]